MVSIKDIVLGIAVFILTLSVGIYGLNTIYGNEPVWDDYCPQITSETECIKNGWEWVNYSYDDTSVNGQPVINKRGSGYCDLYTVCQESYDSALEKYSRNLFFVALPLGILIIALGALVFGLEAVGGGLMAGGVGIILYGVGRFWQFADDWLKFTLSLLGLIAVIWLAYYWNKRMKKKGKQK